MSKSNIYLPSNVPIFVVFSDFFMFLPYFDAFNFNFKYELIYIFYVENAKNGEKREKSLKL